MPIPDAYIPFPERLRIVKEELNKIGIRTETSVSRDQLLLILDRKVIKNVHYNHQIGGKTFDRNVATQLIERIDKDMDGTFTIEEFLRVYFEAEDVLRSKIQDIINLLKEYQQ